MLRATTACTFSTSEPPKVVRTPGVFNILTSKCASRHNGVHFFHIGTSKCASRHNGVHFFHIGTSKVVRTWCVLYIVTSKCASCHNGVHFFDMSTAKSCPDVVCFVHCDFEMCFAPTACTFSTCQLPKVVRTWCVLHILTCKCASRHNGVHFFDISTAKSGPTMVCIVHFDLQMFFAPQRRAIFHLSSGQLAPDPPL